MKIKEVVINNNILNEGWRSALAGIGLAGAIGLAGMNSIKTGVDNVTGNDVQSSTEETGSNMRNAIMFLMANPLSGKSNESILIRKAIKNGITDPIELSSFLSQIGHESAGFSKMIEDGKRSYFNRYEPTHNPKVARGLGNTKPGDGYKYRGRGFIQLTGKYNYKIAGEALGIDLVNNPHLASDVEIASRIAIWYWSTRVQPRVENYADVKRVTRTINGKLKGLDDRKKRFAEYINFFNQFEN
jgi:predicted chitinase